MGDLAGEAGSSPERLRFFSSPRDASGSLFAGGVSSSGGGIRRRLRAGVAWWRSGGGGGRQSSRSAVPNVNLVGRASRGEGAGRAAASVAREDGRDRTWSPAQDGRPGVSARRSRLAHLKRPRPRARRPRRRRPATPPAATRAPPSGRTCRGPGTSASHAAAPRSSSRPSSSSSKCRLALEVLDARAGVPRRAPHSPEAPTSVSFPPRRARQVSLLRSSCVTFPFGGRFLSEGGEFNNSHRKSSA